MNTRRIYCDVQAPNAGGGTIPRVDVAPEPDTALSAEAAYGAWAAGRPLTRPQLAASLRALADAVEDVRASLPTPGLKVWDRTEGAERIQPRTTAYEVVSAHIGAMPGSERRAIVSAAKAGVKR